MDENVGAPLVGAHENISRVEPNENNQGTHKGCPYGVVTLGETVGGVEPGEHIGSPLHRVVQLTAATLH